MPKRCCCNEGPPPPEPGATGCCPPLALNCLGQNINFEFDLTLKLPCHNCWNKEGRYQCINGGNSYSINGNPEKFRVSFSYTVEEPAYVPGLPGTHSYDINQEVPDAVMENYAYCGTNPPGAYGHGLCPGTACGETNCITGLKKSPYRACCNIPIPDPYAIPPQVVPCDTYCDPVEATQGIAARCNFVATPGMTCRKFGNGAKKWRVACDCTNSGGGYGVGGVYPTAYWDCPPPIGCTVEVLEGFGGGPPVVREYPAIYCTNGSGGGGFGNNQPNSCTPFVAEEGNYPTFLWGRCFTNYVLRKPFENPRRTCEHVPKFFEVNYNGQNIGPARQLCENGIVIPPTGFTADPSREVPLGNRQYTESPKYDHLWPYSLSSGYGPNIANMTDSWSIQFIPNPDYPEQMQEDYTPRITPILVGAFYDCKGGTNSAYIDGNFIQVILGLAYNHTFNCGTEANPVPETLDLPYKSIKIIDYYSIFDPVSHSYDCNGDGGWTDYGHPELCPYVFSSMPTIIGSFSRQRVTTLDHMGSCVPKTTKNYPLTGGCNPVNGFDAIIFNDTHYKDEYSVCNTNYYNFNGWILGGQAGIIGQERIELAIFSYPNQFFDQGFRAHSFFYYDEQTGQQRLYRGPCGGTPSIWDQNICGLLPNTNLPEEYWFALPSTIDVTTNF